MRKRIATFALSMAVLVLVFVAGATLVSSQSTSADMFACFRDDTGRVVKSPAECRDNEELGSWYSASAINDLIADASSEQRAQIEQLGALVRRLHGNSAASIDISREGGSDFEATSIKLLLDFCNEAGGPDCADEVYTLETGLLTEEDSGSKITFNAQNTPDFEKIVNLLTNGTSDFLRFGRDSYDAEGVPIGGSSSSASEQYWFRNPDDPTSSVGPDYVDLQGLQIEAIVIDVHSIVLYYSESAGYYRTIVSARAYFMLAD